MGQQPSLNTYLVRFFWAAVVLMTLLTETVIIILFLRAPKPHSPGLGLGLAALFVCVLCLGGGGIQGHRTIKRVRCSADNSSDASLLRVSNLFFGMALIGDIAVIEGLMLLTNLITRSRFPR